MLSHNGVAGSRIDIFSMGRINKKHFAGEIVDEDRNRRIEVI